MKESDKKWKWSFLNNIEIENQEPAGNDKYSFLIAQQAQARWEERYEFDVYSALHKRWLCTICSEYVTSGEKWSTEHVKFHGQPNTQEFKRSQRISTKANWCQTNAGERKHLPTNCKRECHKKGKKTRSNRSVIKKFSKAIYFITRKNWAAWEHFEEIVELL